VTAAVLAVALMIQFEPIERLGIPAGIFGDLRIDGQPLGAVGLAAGSGIAAWVEWWLLRRTLRRKIGKVGAGAGAVARMLAAALAGAGAGWGVRLLLPDTGPRVEAVLVLGTYGLVYFAVAALLRLEEIQGVATRLRRIGSR
jgi:putative peptidoglycan lipid II flippase